MVKNWNFWLFAVNLADKGRNAHVKVLDPAALCLKLTDDSRTSLQVNFRTLIRQEAIKLNSRYKLQTDGMRRMILKSHLYSQKIWFWADKSYCVNKNRFSLSLRTNIMSNILQYMPASDGTIAVATMTTCFVAPDKYIGLSFTTLLLLLLENFLALFIYNKIYSKAHLQIQVMQRKKNCVQIFRNQV